MRLLILILAITGSLVEAQSVFQRKLGCQEGWCPLPPKASYSQCALALERIVKQPQNCGQKYLADTARKIYDPIYNWFGVGVAVNPTWIVRVAAQFAINNGVGVLIFDAFHKVTVHVDNIGGPSITNNTDTIGFGTGRTWGLNYPTFFHYEPNENGSIVQNIWSAKAQLLTIIIYRPLYLLPVVC